MGRSPKEVEMNEFMIVSAGVGITLLLACAGAYQWGFWMGVKS